MIKKSVIELIGNTPIIELSKIYKGKGRIFAKMEYVNPGGSIKDRPALQIILDAYKSGTLSKGKPVVEMTSGNMGAGLAIVCNHFGNPFTAVMSEGNSIERVKFLKALGANVILTKQKTGVLGKVTGEDIEVATFVAKEFAKKKNAFYVDQFNNPSSVRAHFRTTGPEIWKFLKTDLNAFVACIGSAGTFVGTAKYLKSKNEKIECIAVEPKNASILKSGKLKNNKHIIQGTGYGFVPPHWEKNIADKIITVTDDEAYKMKIQLGKLEGLHVGYSASANIVASIKHMKNINQDNYNALTILCDTGFKY